jgi:hypothetical protein
VQVQQGSTATLPPDIDLIRLIKACELRQRPTLTFMQLVHTEEVTGSIPVSPTRSGAMSVFVGIAVGLLPTSDLFRATQPVGVKIWTLLRGVEARGMLT